MMAEERKLPRKIKYGKSEVVVLKSRALLARTLKRIFIRVGKNCSISAKIGVIDSKLQNLHLLSLRTFLSAQSISLRVRLRAMRF